MKAILYIAGELGALLLCIVATVAVICALHFLVSA